MPGAIRRAKEIRDSDPAKYFMPQQFDNPANPEIHRKTTAEEIWRDTDGNVDAFVAAVGTGGTVTGVGEVIKSRKPRGFYVVAVEPDASPVLSAASPGRTRSKERTPASSPRTLNTDIYDEVIRVTNEDAIATARRAAREDGMLLGISAERNLFAALQMAARPEFAGRRSSRSAAIPASGTSRIPYTPIKRPTSSSRHWPKRAAKPAALRSFACEGSPGTNPCGIASRAVEDSPVSDSVRCTRVPVCCRAFVACIRPSVRSRRRPRRTTK